VHGAAPADLIMRASATVSASSASDLNPLVTPLTAVVLGIARVVIMAAIAMGLGRGVRRRPRQHNRRAGLFIILATSHVFDRC